MRPVERVKRRIEGGPPAGDSALADEMGCSTTTVRRARRAVGGPKPKLRCDGCGRTFRQGFVIKQHQRASGHQGTTWTEPDSNTTKGVNP